MAQAFLKTLIFQDIIEKLYVKIFVGVVVKEYQDFNTEALELGMDEKESLHSRHNCLGYLLGCVNVSFLAILSAEIQYHNLFRSFSNIFPGMQNILCHQIS